MVVGGGATVFSLLLSDYYTREWFVIINDTRERRREGKEYQLESTPVVKTAAVASILIIHSNTVCWWTVQFITMLS